jgi:tetratricopeptide (TPR) repeat protein
MVLAAALRAAHVLALQKLPIFDVLILDSWMYDVWAQRIASGDWLGGPRPFYQDPLYPYFLAAVYKVVGRDLLVVRWLQVGLGVATCGLVGVIGRRVGGALAGNVAALLFAVYRPEIFQEGELEKTALSVFLVTAALWLALRQEVGARLAAGVALGLAALTRGNLLLVVPLAALWFLFEPLPKVEASSDHPGWRRLRPRLLGRPGQSVCAFLAGFLLPIAPVTWRNHHVSGEWVLTTSAVGQVFYTGNNPANESGGFEHVPFVRSNPENEEQDFLATAEARVGRPLGAREASDFWLREALAHLRERPWFAARVALRKVGLILTDYEVPDAWDMYFLARFSPVLGFPLIGMGVLLPLAALGATVSFRSRREARMIVGFVGVYALSLAALFVFSRYRLQVVPALAVLAGLAIPWMGQVWRTRDIRRGVGGALGLGATALLSFTAGPDPGIHHAVHVHSFVNLSMIYEQRGEIASSEKLLAQASELNPGSAEPPCARGALRVRTGRPANALGDLRRCLSIDPSYPDAWLVLGMAYDGVGDPHAAAQAYREQLARVPGHAEAMQRLRWAEFRGGGPR